MRFEDWHTHSLLCRHAIGTFEDYINKAIELNLNILGVSDHFPYEYLKDSMPLIQKVPYEEYGMKLSEMEDYLSTLEYLKDKYKNKIDIKIAFEVDFFENQESLVNKYLNPIISKLDYILGSVHIIFDNHGIFAFDDRRFIKIYENYNSIDEIYLEYYNTVQKMIKSKNFEFDVLTHFDLPKKFNKRPENKEFIMNKVLDTLDIAKKRDLAIEINTSGLRRDVQEQYPSFKIIEYMHELGIPILLGSDSHHPDEIAYEFDWIIMKLKRVGYKEFAHFDKRKRSYVKLE